MLKTFVLLCCGAVAAFGADDPWAKVKEIKSGAELRIFKRGSSQPLLVKMDEASDERIVVVNKNEQTAIAKEDIDRVEARPSAKRGVTKESKTTVNDAASDPRSTIPSPASRGSVGGGGGTSTSTSTGYSIGGKPAFELVYQRPPALPKK
jgi:hypothetical protein